MTQKELTPKEIVDFMTLDLSGQKYKRNVIRLYRYGNHANDTNTGETKLFAAELRLS